MRPYLLSILIAITSFPHVVAANNVTTVDPFVKDQLRADYSELAKQQLGGRASEEQQKAFVNTLVAQIIQDEPIFCTRSEVDALRYGLFLFTDAEVRAAYSKMKAQAQLRPMPVVVEFYKSLYDSGKMNATEQAIFVKLTLSIAAKGEKVSH